MAQKPSTTAENYEWILRVVDEFRLIDVKSYTLTLSLSLSSFVSVAHTEGNIDTFGKCCIDSKFGQIESLFIISTKLPEFDAHLVKSSGKPHENLCTR